MDTLILNDAEREELKKTHPVITKKYVIVTPVIEDVYALLRDRVYMRSTGTFIYAQPRMGKSTCVRAIKGLLQTEYPEIFLMSVIAEKKKKQSTSFLIDILQADQLFVAKGIRFKEAQRNVLTHIQSNVAMKAGNQFVLIIDDMHNLTGDELYDLTTIHNRLETLNIRMTTLGFAQPEILDLRTSFQASNETFLIARFLSEPIPFYGCSEISDLKSILKAYDSKLFYPEGSQISYTNFFLPKATEGGFLLATDSMAEMIWSELSSAALNLSSASIPMEHVTRTIEYLLVMSAKLDCSNFLDSSNIEALLGLVKEAVRASNLSYFSGLIFTPKI